MSPVQKAPKRLVILRFPFQAPRSQSSARFAKRFTSASECQTGTMGIDHSCGGTPISLPRKHPRGLLNYWLEQTSATLPSRNSARFRWLWPSSLAKDREDMVEASEWYVATKVGTWWTAGPTYLGHPHETMVDVVYTFGTIEWGCLIWRDGIFEDIFSPRFAEVDILILKITKYSPQIPSPSGIQKTKFIWTNWRCKMTLSQMLFYSQKSTGISSLSPLKWRFLWPFLWLIHWKKTTQFSKNRIWNIQKDSNYQLNSSSPIENMGDFRQAAAGGPGPSPGKRPPVSLVPWPCDHIDVMFWDIRMTPMFGIWFSWCSMLFWMIIQSYKWHFMLGDYQGDKSKQ